MTAKDPSGQDKRPLPPKASQRAAQQENNGELSDLNHDRTVDALDLELFATQYLEQDPEEVEWCAFHRSAIANPRFFRKQTAANPARFTRLLKYIEGAYDCPRTPRAVDKSDLNGDGEVGADDLHAFSVNYFEQHRDNFAWCRFYESTVAGADFEERRTRFFLQHYRLLLTFINDHFGCDAPPLPSSDILLENEPKLLARMARPEGIDPLYYVTDPRVGSVFILDHTLTPRGELKGLDRPLGVALDSRGNLLVGNDGRDNVEVYDPLSGALLAVFGAGEILMPTAITVDALGEIYVTDSRSHNVKVFAPDYTFVRLIGVAGVGDEELYFPTDTAVAVTSGEVFVADQGNKRVQVYDLDGRWLRSIHHYGVCGWRGCTSPPFTMVQSLGYDSAGRLHVLDSYNAMVMIFNPATGEFLGTYGQYGESDGYLVIPADVLISETNEALVTSGDGDRIEVYSLP